MPYKTVWVVLALSGLFLLAACDSSDVTMYEPGVYKGKPDEMATEEAAAARRDQLRDRAMTGMTDR